MDKRVKRAQIRAMIASNRVRALGFGKLIELTPKSKLNVNKNCVQCGIEIPPGRYGRKCKKCREQPNGMIGPTVQIAFAKGIAAIEGKN